MTGSTGANAAAFTRTTARQRLGRPGRHGLTAPGMVAGAAVAGVITLRVAADAFGRAEALAAVAGAGARITGSRAELRPELPDSPAMRENPDALADGIRQDAERPEQVVDQAFGDARFVAGKDDRTVVLPVDTVDVIEQHDRQRIGERPQAHVLGREQLEGVRKGMDSIFRISSATQA